MGVTNATRGRAGAVLAVLLTLAAVSPAASQIEPLPGDNPVVLPGIDISALGDPPWWTVSKGDSTVYFLASPGAPVEAWDTSRLQEILQGANRLILPPDIKTGLAVVTPQLRNVAQIILKDKTTRLEHGLVVKKSILADVSGSGPLPEFRAARQKAGMPESRYGGLSLKLAVFALAGDVYDRLARQPGEPVEQTAAKIAQARGVPSGPAVSYGGKDWTDLLDKIGAVDFTCLRAALRDLDAAPARVQPEQIKAETEAWAYGDVKPVLHDGVGRAPGLTLRMADKDGVAILAVHSPYCLGQIPQFKQASDRWLADETDAVVSALKTPGKTVVVYSATDLFYVGGVFDQLIKRGFTVDGPVL